MGKLGKILAPVVAVFAIAALVMSFLVAKQGKLFRERSAVLAQGLVSAAQKLDSGSGDKGKVTFTKAENGAPEDGTLGWPKYQENADGYASSANAVAGLASKVIDQRDFIIEKLVETSAHLETPADRQPSAEALQSLQTYEEGAGDFFQFVDDRVQRDKNVVAAINQFAVGMGVRRTFTGAIQPGGVLAKADSDVFNDIRGRVTTLQGNYRSFQKFLREAGQNLRSIPLEEGAWNATDPSLPAYSNGGMDSKDAGELTAMMAKFTADFQTIRTQMARIPQLTNDLENAREEIEKQKKAYAALMEKYEKDEEVIQNYYKQGLGMSSATNDKVVKNSYEEVRKDLSGEVLQADANFGYVIVNLTNCDVLDDINLSVHRLSDGKYLGVIKVVNAGEFNSICTMVSGEISNISVGDKVVVGSAAIQGK